MNSKFRIFRNAQTPIFSEKVPNFLFKVFVRIVRNALSKETKKFCCIILLFFFKIYTNVFFKYFACLVCTFAAICKHYCICEWKSLKYLKINLKKNSQDSCEKGLHISHCHRRLNTLFLKTVSSLWMKIVVKDKVSVFFNILKAIFWIYH